LYIIEVPLMLCRLAKLSHCWTLHCNCARMAIIHSFSNGAEAFAVAVYCLFS